MRVCWEEILRVDREIFPIIITLGIGLHSQHDWGMLRSIPWFHSLHLIVSFIVCKSNDAFFFARWCTNKVKWRGENKVHTFGLVIKSWLFYFHELYFIWSLTCSSYVEKCTPHIVVMLKHIGIFQLYVHFWNEGK